MRFRIYTLGCKVNQYESEAIRQFLAEKGFREVSRGPADFYIVNSCTVTHTADAKSLKFIRRSKAENPKGTVVATGCLADGAKERIKREGADYIIPQREKFKVLSIFDKNIETGGLWPFKIKGFSRNRAFVKVQDGCDNLCSFCKVRIVRGRSRSRACNDIVDEVARLAKAGFREVVLCGINVGSFRQQDKDLVDLLKQTLKIKEVRIRLSSLEPAYITDRLLLLFATETRLCPHFHIPFQSGSSRVLRAMNKDTTAHSYFRLLEKIRSQLPDCGISCDIMLGFPGEEEEDFRQTLKLIDFSQPVRTHIFSYSQRQGTASARFTPIGPKIVKERFVRAMARARSASYKFRQAYEGKVFPVIFDTNTLACRMLGYTANYIRVAADAKPAGLQIKSLKEPRTVKIISTDYDQSYGTIAG